MIWLPRHSRLGINHPSDGSTLTVHSLTGLVNNVLTENINPSPTRQDRRLKMRSTSRRKIKAELRWTHQSSAGESVTTSEEAKETAKASARWHTRHEASSFVVTLTKFIEPPYILQIANTYLLLNPRRWLIAYPPAPSTLVLSRVYDAPLRCPRHPHVWNHVRPSRDELMRLASGAQDDCS